MGNYIEHPLIQENKIETRLYQQVLAANTLKKGNTMIVAPTALGKTVVAALISANRLKKFKNSKILMLAPTKPLVIQHEESFRNFLMPTATSITGAINPEERAKRWKESQIICATPQTVESDIIHNRYSLKDVSLIVFDECHRAVGSYSYVYLANQYINEAKNSLILGLTASPGSDQDKIYNVCENLFIEDVVVKTEEDSDVSPYFNPIKVDWVKLELGEELQRIKDHLNKALKYRLKTLKSLGVIKTIAVGKRDLLKARGIVQNRIARSANPPKECYRAISLIAAAINVQHALELLETQGIATLHQYLNRLEKKNTKAAKGLVMDADFSPAIKLTKHAFNNGIEHPKLKKLMGILKKELKNKGSKVIVFTQFRDTVELIHESCSKEGINSVKFYGQGKRNGEKGLTQKQQKDIIKGFKMGNYDVLISTSVAEEGIDIPAVDLVVLYEPVPSEIRMIQRRGRTGRKTEGKMKVLITKGTRDEAYYWSSINKENKMKRDLLDVNKLDLEKNREKVAMAQSNIRNTTIKPRREEGYNSDLEAIDNAIDEVKNESKNDSMETSNEEEKSTQYPDENEDMATTKPKIEPLPKHKKKYVLNKPKIIADSREGNSRVLRELTKLGIDIKVETLAIGDYQITDDLIIERKTASDFVSSITDKRLYKQAKDMVDNFKKPVIILEGDNLYSGFMNPNAVRGALAAIAIDFGIPILPTRGPEDTAAMIRRIIIREQNPNKAILQTRTEKKPLTLLEQKLFIIESLPNVGPVTARKLLEEFGSVKNIINASEKELQEVEGIGKKIAKQILKVLGDVSQDDVKDFNMKLID